MENFEVIFDFIGIKLAIQCSPNEKMEDICLRFANKSEQNLDELIFLCNGDILNLEKTLKDTMNKEDTSKKNMNVVAYKSNTTLLGRNNMGDADQGITKSKDIICPKCKELCRLNIINFKVILYGCQNGHKKNNIYLDDFNNTQLINESKIKCENCNDKNKYNSYQKQFYKCLACSKNLCPLCKEAHDEEHKKSKYIIDYDSKNYICNIHNFSLISYCKECKSNLCIYCPEHEKSHKIVELKTILPKKEIINEEIVELRKKIDKFNHIIMEIIEKIQKVKENMETFYKINYDILNNYENQKLNYHILQNVNAIFDNIKLNSIDEIINDNTKLGEKAMNILNIYDKMFNKENNHDVKTEKIDKIEKQNKEKPEKAKLNETQKNYHQRKSTFGLRKNLVLNYNDQIQVKVKNDKENTLNKNKKSSINNTNEKKPKKNNQTKNQKDSSNDYKTLIDESLEKDEILLWYKIYDPKMKKLKIFGDLFINKNKDNCSMIYDNKTMKISEYINLTDEMQKKQIKDLKIKLKINNIRDMSYMFYDCKTLYSIGEDSKFDTSGVTDMSYMFYNCNSLSILSCISKWNTSNVESMNYIFYGCVSLKTLPDISNWDTRKVTEMEHLFGDCYNLETLPDISKWDTSNVTKMNGMFNSCGSLITVPDISKWNTSNVTDFNSMFNSCTKLQYIPDISKWNDQKVRCRYNMFRCCESLKSYIPDKFK